MRCVCPYPNARRGNIDVAIDLVQVRPVANVAVITG
jgi:hypothetical protein